MVFQIKAKTSPTTISKRRTVTSKKLNFQQPRSESKNNHHRSMTEAPVFTDEVKESSSPTMLEQKAVIFFRITKVADRKDKRKGGRQGGVGFSRNGATVSDILNSSSHTRHKKKYKNVFVGKETVDLMLAEGLASTRKEAVELGNKFASKLKLFRHVNSENTTTGGYKRKKHINKNQRRNAEVAQTILLGTNAGRIDAKAPNGLKDDDNADSCCDDESIFIDDENAFYTFGSGAISIIKQLDGDEQGTASVSNLESNMMNEKHSKPEKSSSTCKSATKRDATQGEYNQLPSPPSFCHGGILIPSPPSAESSACNLSDGGESIEQEFTGMKTSRKNKRKQQRPTNKKNDTVIACGSAERIFIELQSQRSQSCLLSPSSSSSVYTSSLSSSPSNSDNGKFYVTRENRPSAASSLSSSPPQKKTKKDSSSLEDATKSRMLCVIKNRLKLELSGEEVVDKYAAVVDEFQDFMSYHAPRFALSSAPISTTTSSIVIPRKKDSFLPSDIVSIRDLKINEGNNATTGCSTDDNNIKPNNDAELPRTIQPTKDFQVKHKKYQPSSVYTIPCCPTNKATEAITHVGADEITLPAMGFSSRMAAITIIDNDPSVMFDRWHTVHGTGKKSKHDDLQKESKTNMLIEHVKDHFDTDKSIGSNSEVTQDSNRSDSSGSDSSSSVLQLNSIEDDRFYKVAMNNYHGNAGTTLEPIEDASHSPLPKLEDFSDDDDDAYTYSSFDGSFVGNSVYTLSLDEEDTDDDQVKCRATNRESGDDDYTEVTFVSDNVELVSYYEEETVVPQEVQKTTSRKIQRQNKQHRPMPLKSPLRSVLSLSRLPSISEMKEESHPGFFLCPDDVDDDEDENTLFSINESSRNLMMNDSTEKNRSLRHMYALNEEETQFKPVSPTSSDRLKLVLLNCLASSDIETVWLAMDELGIIASKEGGRDIDELVKMGGIMTIMSVLKRFVENRHIQMTCLLVLEIIVKLYPEAKNGIKAWDGIPLIKESMNKHGTQRSLIKKAQGLLNAISKN